MDLFFSLILILGGAIPFAVLYLLISNVRLRRRVAALEAQMTTGTLREASPWAQTSARAQPETAAPEIAGETAPEERSGTAIPGKKRIGALLSWLTRNWFYAVSAISLALAGIFLVLYGMEKGILPPSARILAALIFGAALIGSGEYLRRRFGDGEASATAYLPSTFSGAGIVTLFGTVLAARLLYGFIGPEMALIGMALVGLVAMVLGWFHGPFLAAVGVTGAMIAPFIIGGSSEDPSLLLTYFGIVAVTGLAIDALRRWAWVSVISVASGFGAGTLLMQASRGGAVEPWFMLYCAALALAAIVIPVRKLLPDHAGTPLCIAIFAREEDDPLPEFPTLLANGAVMAASGLIALVAHSQSREDIFWPGIITLSVLLLFLSVQARKAPALVDLTLWPAAALVAVVASGAPLWASYQEAALLPEADMPLMASIVVGIGILLSAVAAWRSLREPSGSLLFALISALIAPAVAIMIEIAWSPVLILGREIWALHAMAIAAMMVAIAGRLARADGPEDRERMSFVVLSALASIAFGVVILFSSAALTMAFSLTVLAAAWLDRRFNMPLMGLYILAGVTTVGFRLVADPGIGWATDAPLADMLLSHGGALLAFALSWLLVKSARRPRSEILLESAIFSTTGILVSLLLYRVILSEGGRDAVGSHWAMGIEGSVWLALGLARLRRLETGGPLARLRPVLAIIFLMIAGFHLLLAMTLLNPLFGDFGSPVLGPVVINTLIPAYLLPALLLFAGCRWLQGSPKLFRIPAASIALLLAGLWLGLTIRHFWRGAEGMELPAIGQPELYSYTVVLLLIGAGLFYQALARRHALLRKAGLLFIGVAVVKVFVVDISGLGGLIRIFALLVLGLSLAALAWLNRWAAIRFEPGAERDDP